MEEDFDTRLQVQQATTTDSKSRLRRGGKNVITQLYAHDPELVPKTSDPKKHGVRTKEELDKAFNQALAELRTQPVPYLLPRFVKVETGVFGKLHRSADLHLTLYKNQLVKLQQSLRQKGKDAEARMTTKLIQSLDEHKPLPISMVNNAYRSLGDSIVPRIKVREPKRIEEMKNAL